MSDSLTSVSSTFPHEVLYRTFFDNFVDEMYLHDEQGILLDVNDAACANMGYTRQELIGMKVSDISVGFSEQDLIDFWQNNEECSSISASNCHRRKDGSTYQLDVHIICMRLQGKKFFLAAVRNTDEKVQQANEILQLNKRLRSLVDERTRLWKESSRLLNAVMEQTPDAIFIKDMQGRYQYVNHAFAMQLDLEVGDILGRNRLLHIVLR